MDLDVRRMRYFSAIVDAGSLNAAGRRLRVTQPTLSATVRELERLAGTALLVRTPTGVVPTEAGRYLYQEATRITRDVADTTDHLRSLARGTAGRIAIAATPSFCWGPLPQVLSRFAAAAPDVQIVLDDPPPLMIVEQVRDARCAVGIVATNDVTELRTRYGGHLRLTTIGTLSLAVVLPCEVNNRGVVPFSELQKRAWIVPRTALAFPGVAAAVETLWRRHHWRPAVVREVSTSQTAIPMIAGGLGVGIAPRSLGALAGPTVSMLDLDEPLRPLTAVALTLRGATSSPAARLFLDTLALGDEAGATTGKVAAPTGHRQ